ncbi:hypothetical protein BDY21DRAFT_358418, partial [Lineolata rhizophorae]
MLDVLDWCTATTCAFEEPPVMKPRKHSLHRTVRQPVQKGSLQASSDAFIPAFKSLEETIAKRHLQAASWPQDLLVTTDFT